MMGLCGMLFNMKYIVLVLILFFPIISYADEIPKMCDEREAIILCILKIQRNNILDELAISEGKRKDAENVSKIKEIYWHDYVVGIDRQSSWWTNLWEEYFGHSSKLSQKDKTK